MLKICYLLKKAIQKYNLCKGNFYWKWSYIHILHFKNCKQIYSNILQITDNKRQYILWINLYDFSIKQFWFIILATYQIRKYWYKCGSSVLYRWTQTYTGQQLGACLYSLPFKELEPNQIILQLLLHFCTVTVC